MYRHTKMSTTICITIVVVYALVRLIGMVYNGQI